MTMQKLIEASDLECRLNAVLDDVAGQRASYIVDRNGQPAAAVVPYEEYQQYRAWATRHLRERAAKMLHEIAKETEVFSDEEVEADVRAALREVRAAGPDGA